MNSKTLIPRLYDHLELYEQDDFYFIKNYLSNTTFKVSRSTYVLLKTINGKNSLIEIQHLLNNEYGFLKDINELNTFIYDKLTSKGIVQSDKPIILQKRSYLKLNVTLLNERIVANLATFFSCFFNKYIFTIIIMFCFTSLFLISRNLKSNFYTTFLSFNIYELSFLIPLFIVNLLFHELGHASACKYFRVKPGRIGFGFYFISPVLFADVSSAWRLSKYKRIVVNLGGIYFELVFISILSICFFITHQVFIATVIAFILLQTILLNLNPFLRADGYWLLSDILSIYNLKSRSNLALKEAIKSRSLIRGNKFLIFYASLNFVVFIAFIFYNLAYQGDNLLNFPMFIFGAANDILRMPVHVIIEKLAIPALFYGLIVNLLIGMLKK